MSEKSLAGELERSGFGVKHEIDEDYDQGHELLVYRLSFYGDNEFDEELLLDGGDLFDNLFEDGCDAWLDVVLIANDIKAVYITVETSMEIIVNNDNIEIINDEFSIKTSVKTMRGINKLYRRITGKGLTKTKGKL